MGKIIIENRSNSSDLVALEAVKCVMGSGRVSNYGKQYCYMSLFKNGLAVSSSLNKKSDRFVVFDYPSTGEKK